MVYYHVWVRSEQYRSNEPLTYSATKTLSHGSIVVVPLRQQQVVGVVIGQVQRPAFTTKPIITAYDLPPLPAETIKLMAWLQHYYPSPIGVISQLFLPHRIYEPTDQDPASKPPDPAQVPQASLTPDQQHALKQINQPETYLLHGRTGSGKTRIYIEL